MLDKVKSIVENAIVAESAAELQEIIEREIPKVFRLDPEKYPRLDFYLSEQDIKNVGIEKLKEGCRLALPPESEPFARLLYAFVWKQGDLKKICHVVEGIRSEVFTGINDEKNTGLILYNFGKYLRTREPIVDQHVLRAFEQFKIARGQPIDLGPKKKDKTRMLISAYKKWMKQTFTKDSQVLPDFRYELDKLMFGLGKSIKKECMELANPL